MLMMLKNGLTSNYDKNDKRPLSICKNIEVTSPFKNELGGKF